MSLQNVFCKILTSASILEKKNAIDCPSLVTLLLFELDYIKTLPFQYLLVMFF